MVVVEIIGGLGNQMFQYALGKRLSLSLKTDMFLDKTGFQSYDLHAFGLNQLKTDYREADHQLLTKFHTPRILQKVLRSFLSSYPLTVKEKFFNFDPDILRLQGHLYLRGYWQSEKYFSEIRKELLHDFTPKEMLSPKATSFSEAMKAGNSVSLHIRRGDYASNAKTLSVHGLQPISYYVQAAELVAAKVNSPEFFIFSDDIQWAKQNLQFLKNVQFVSENEFPNFVELTLMSHCKHNIIANSSFSWWGAWLNQNSEKIVIGPRKWFAGGKRNTVDILPDSWVKL